MKANNNTSSTSSIGETKEESKTSLATLSNKEMYELEKEINEKMGPFAADDEERQKKSWIRASKLKIG